MDGLEVAGISGAIVFGKALIDYLIARVQQIRAEERRTVAEKQERESLGNEAVRRSKVDDAVERIPFLKEMLRDHEVRLKATEENLTKVLDGQELAAINSDKQLTLLTAIADRLDKQ